MSVNVPFRCCGEHIFTEVRNKQILEAIVVVSPIQTPWPIQHAQRPRGHVREIIAVVLEQMRSRRLARGKSLQTRPVDQEMSSQPSLS